MPFLLFVLSALSYPSICWNVDITPHQACVIRSYSETSSREDRICFESKDELFKFVNEKKLPLCMDKDNK